MQRPVRARQPAGLDGARGGQRRTLEEGEKGGPPRWCSAGPVGPWQEALMEGLGDPTILVFEDLV